MYKKETFALIKKEIEEIERMLALIKMQMENLQKEDSENNLPNEQLLSQCVTDEKQRNLFHKAIDQGLIGWNEHGKLEGRMPSKTLVAYLVGRLWLRDEVAIDRITHEKLWASYARFPVKRVASLFEETRLRELRKNKRMLPLPIGHELIDRLLENECVAYHGA